MNRREAIAALMALPATPTITRANVQPDDVIVIECPGRIPMEAAERIQKVAEQAWPGRKVLVLSDGLTVKIVRASGVANAGAERL